MTASNLAIRYNTGYVTKSERARRRPIQPWHTRPTLLVPYSSTYMCSSKARYLPTCLYLVTHLLYLTSVVPLIITPP